MVTVCQRPIDTISGFASGIDDYITKPFNPNELLMRVNVGRRIVQLETSQMTIFALAKLAESRDPETGAHLERVRTYARLLAKQLQTSPGFREPINDEFVRLIYETSPLHDIGKVAIPDAILLKPGELTATEFDVMKTHTLRGAETLEAALQEFPNARFLRMAKSIALSHHERYDGTGYPQGLIGDQIPLCGRIVALADVYDALTTKRVYKEAMSHPAAKAIIVGQRARHFDPAVVDAFLEVEEEFRAIHSQYADTIESVAASAFSLRDPDHLVVGHNLTSPWPAAQYAAT
jgi:putative two-component system response regulator